MHFSSFFSLSSIIFVLDSCRPTAAAALAISPVKRGRVIDTIECDGPFPSCFPGSFPRFPNLQHMCASKEGHHSLRSLVYLGNLECTCYGHLLMCGHSLRSLVWLLTTYCLVHCKCGPDTTAEQEGTTKEITYYDEIPATGDAGQVVSVGTGRSRAHRRQSRMQQGL